MRRLLAFVIALACLAVGLAGCTRTPGQNEPTGGAPGSSADTVLDPAAVQAAVDALGSAPGKDLKPNRLAPGLLPPTNRWFSGLVFGDQAQPVFPMPLSFGVDGKGFSLGLPTVTTSAKTIMGSYKPLVQVGLGTPSWQVTGYDDLSVTLTASNGASKLGEIRLTQGSPFITYTADAAQRVSTNVAFVQSGGQWTAKDGNTTYVVVADNGTISQRGVDLQARGSVTFFVVPEGGDAQAMAELAKPKITGTKASYEVGSDAKTTLTYETSGGPTALALEPHQQGAASSCTLGTYASILGTMKVCSGNEISWTTPVYAARTQLDLSRLSDDEKGELKTALDADLAAAKPYPADTYFGGKALFRDAQLYTIAKQIGATQQADSLKQKVTDSLTRWTTASGCQQAQAFCFSYDSTNKGIVGKAASFGSDEFNDHHFHYGYFLYAAGVMAADDPGLADRIKPVMNLLAADIATSPATELFPQRRVFDVYNSHSWASGTAPFADGNNQESVSEAVNAWSGLTLWARASGNAKLEAEARWMHALEAQSARAYWTNFDKSQPVYQGFGHEVTPLVFGGKRDYATWFSAEPAAALAILLIPMNPSSDFLGGDPARIDANVKEGTASGGFTQQYGDLMLMYAAMAGEQQRTAALQQARSLPAGDVDDSTSKTYLLAWLFSLKK